MSNLAHRLLLTALATTAAVAQQPDVAGWNLSDPASRAARVAELRGRAETNRASAHAQARREGWSPAGEARGRRFELQAYRDGRPRIYAEENAHAAISTAADLLWPAPYQLSGQGLTIGIWDGGSVRSTHQELNGRVTVMDGAAVAQHATHVGGTLIASGVTASARGMAGRARLDSYDWNSDDAEMTARGMAATSEVGRIQLSNHSYGYLTGWDYGNYSGVYAWHWFGVWGEREDRNFGMYSSVATNWDHICRNAPYYLPCKSAGNDRNDAGPAAGETFYYYNAGWIAKTYVPATDPYTDGWDNGGYDTIGDNGVSKNVLTVGAVNDAVSGGVRLPANGTMSSFSCWGPADDGRIKPDVVANGVDLTSCDSAGDAAYVSMSGTSMSTPNACGTLALLVEYWRALFGTNSYPLSSTLKALVIHTADDLGNAGPDYQNGWGLINAQSAANLLLSHSNTPAASRVVENFLSSTLRGRTNTVISDGTQPLRITLCWTDPAGAAQTTLDNTTARLVNNLNLRLVSPSGVTNFPYLLIRTNPSAAAVTGTNNVDNVEQIYLASPAAGTYRLIIAINSTVSGTTQRYSVVTSGNVAGSLLPLVVQSSPAGVGSAVPALGTNQVSSGTVVNAYTPGPWTWISTTGLATYACTGWTGNGSVSVLGAGTGTTFTLNNASTLTWHWVLSDLVLSNTTVSGVFTAAVRDTLSAGRSYALSSTSRVEFQAGRWITMRPAFSAPTGSQLRVRVP